MQGRKCIITIVMFAHYTQKIHHRRTNTILADLHKNQMNCFAGKWPTNLRQQLSVYIVQANTF